MTYIIERQYDYKSDGSCKWEPIKFFEDRDLASQELANLRHFHFTCTYRIFNNTIDHDKQNT